MAYAASITTRNHRLAGPVGSSMWRALARLLGAAAAVINTVAVVVAAPRLSPSAEVVALLVLTTNVAALVSFAVQQPVDRYMASRLKAGGHR